MVCESSDDSHRRPKLYPDAASKQRAYRVRLAEETMLVNRRRWAELEGRTDRLAEAVAAARKAGCPIAKQIRGSMRETVLDELAAWFEGRAVALKETGGELPPPQRIQAGPKGGKKEGSAPKR